MGLGWVGLLLGLPLSVDRESQYFDKAEHEKLREAVEAAPNEKAVWVEHTEMAEATWCMDPKPITFMFLAHGGLFNEDMWLDFFEDGKAWLKDNACRNVNPNLNATNIPVINLLLDDTNTYESPYKRIADQTNDNDQRNVKDSEHYTANADEPFVTTDLESSPPGHRLTFKDQAPFSKERFPGDNMLHVIRTDHPCQWGFLTQCEAELLRTSLSRAPKSEYFILVSGDAVPLKSYAYIFSHLNEGRRSLFDIVSTSFLKSKTAKAKQWFVLLRKHAELLAANENLWAHQDWKMLGRHGTEGFAAPDEWAPLSALSALEDHEQLGKELNAQSSKYDDIKPAGDRSGFTWVCWTLSCMGHPIGDLATDQWPGNYKVLNQPALQKLTEQPELLFMRKVSNGLTIRINDTLIPVADYLRAHMFHNIANTTVREYSPSDHATSHIPFFPPGM